MTVLRILVAVLLLLVIPAVVGSLFRREVDQNVSGPIFWWVSGQIFLWACFQLLCVPLILMEGDFKIVIAGYTLIQALAVLAAVVRGFRKRKTVSAASWVRGFDRKKSVRSVLWILFWALLIFQLIQAVRMTYRDGDDAFYVAITSITQEAETMYRKLPYTGFGTELDVRHGLAPFPVWISYLAKMTGIQGVSMAHVVVPVALIAMTYGVFYLLGGILLQEKKDVLPLFLIFTEILVLFGDYSFYTVENFMIARSRQGKAALGSIVIPVLLLLLLLLLRKLQEGGAVSLQYFVLLAAANAAGCLCSTMGAMLCCMLVGIVGVCGALVYKKWKMLIPMAFCCLPNVCYAFLYLVLD